MSTLADLHDNTKFPEILTVSLPLIDHLKAVQSFFCVSHYPACYLTNFGRKR